ncbi:MAG: hypothetical protein NXI31_26950 [bacterium]|nr:hypothetical protein [bacterium]
MRALLHVAAGVAAFCSAASAQSIEIALLQRGADGSFVPFVVGEPMPNDVVSGGSFLLRYPKGVIDAEAADATFATDPAGEVIQRSNGDQLLFVPRSVPRTELPGGKSYLELWIPARAAGGAPRKQRFEALGVTVRPVPPGWQLLGLDGKPVDVGLKLPLLIESPLRVVEPPPPAPMKPKPDENVTNALLELIDKKVKQSRKVKPGDKPSQGSSVSDRLSLLENPDTANKLIQRLMERDSGLAFLKDFNLAVKAFDDENGQSALGFSYDYAKTWRTGPDSHSTPDHGFEFELAARGNVVFDSTFNPEDFLDTKFEYRYYRSNGGVRDDLPDPTPEQKAERLDRVNKLAEFGDDYKSSALYIEHSRDIRQAMEAQVHFDLGVNGGVEANQDFTARNYTYGFEAMLDVKVWDPTDPWCNLNLLDIPFAALRLVTGYDQEFTVRGSTIPTFLVAIDQVEPDGGNPRAMVNDDSSFGRLRGEVSFRTPIAWIRDSQTYFNANYRIYHELNASQAVENADLETFHFVALSITTDAGFLVTYTRGQLPFDVADSESIQVGWAFNF